MRKGGSVSARKFLAPQYLGKVPPLNMESGAFLGINNKVGTIATVIAKSGTYSKSSVLMSPTKKRLSPICISM